MSDSFGGRGRAIVVGAGVAGLAAARALTAAGWRVTILEARERAGGRIFTDRSNPDLPLDLGPSWVHGTEGNPVAHLLEQAGARFETTDWDSYALYVDGKPQEDCDWAFAVFDFLEERKDRISRDETVGAAMQRFFAKRAYSALEAGRDPVEPPRASAPGDWAGLLATAPFLEAERDDFDPEQAKKWLAEAGYPDGKGFPEVSFLWPDVSSNRIIAEALQSMWKMYLGVKVNLMNQEWKVYLSTINTDPPEIHRAGWGADFPDPHNFMTLFTCTSGNNRTRWCNMEYDALVYQAAEETDPAKRKELYDKAQKILTENDVPIVPFFVSNQQNMIKPYVKGLVPNPLDLVLFKYVYFEDPAKESEAAQPE